MRENFKRKVLPSGLTILFEKRDVPVVSVGYAVRHGGVNEDVSEKGLSHFIEHMLYKGTKSRDSKKIAEDIERRGGFLNGLTAEELTTFFVKISSKHLNIALDVLTDIVKNPLFDKKELDKERKVIFEEIKMYKDDPRRYVFDKIKECLYDQTMSMNLAGTFETMEGITQEYIKKRFSEIYSPNNLVLCVVGDARFEDIVDFAEKNFSRDNFKIKEQKFNELNLEKKEQRKDIDQANLVFAYHIPFASEKGSIVAEILGEIMAPSMSSRLFQELRSKRNLAYAILGGSESGNNFGYSFIYVGTPPEQVDEIKTLILREFEKVSAELKEKELKEVKEQLVGQYLISMEDSQDQMLNLFVKEIHGNAEEFYNFEKRVRAVKLTEVKEMAKKVLDNHSFFVLSPFD